MISRQLAPYIEVFFKERWFFLDYSSNKFRVNLENVQPMNLILCKSLFSHTTLI